LLAILHEDGPRGWKAHCLTEGLAGLRDPRAVEPLITMLRDERWHEQHSDIIRALGEIGDTRAVEHLIPFLDYCDPRKTPGVYREYRYTCGAAVEALGKIGDARAVEPLLAVLRCPFHADLKKECVIEALVRIGDPRAIEPLLGLLSEQDVSDLAGGRLSTGPSFPLSDRVAVEALG
jgi:HEAT repeat protein